MAKILHLNLKGEYFDDIKAGTKPFEYRLKDDYWINRLLGREYDEIHFKRGYPSKDALDKIIKVPYRGYELQTITHKHFGEKPVEVFAIYTTEVKSEHDNGSK
jgi:ASC-1-like (ASCH) protein